MKGSAFPLVPFLQAVSDCTGGNAKVQRKEYATEGELPVIDQGQEFIAGFTGTGNQYQGKLPLVLFGDHTRIFKYVDFPFALGADGVKALQPQSGFDAKFLFYYFRFIALPNAGYSRHFKFLKEIQVPKPSLAEQRRIVDLLSRAEGIVRLRREAQKKAAELIPALFLEMFGDPATNPKGWPVAPLGDHVEIASTVRTPDLDQDADQPCIGADSIESHTGKLISLPTVRDMQPKSGKYWFDFGDVLYSKIRPYLAKASLAPRGGYCSADMYPLRCKSSLQAEFLLGLLLSKAFTDYATAESVRAQMPKLNRETLFAYQFPVPPIEIQEQFNERATTVRPIQSLQSDAAAKAEATFDALLAQVF